MRRGKPSNQLGHRVLLRLSVAPTNAVILLGVMNRASRGDCNATLAIYVAWRRVGQLGSPPGS